MTNIRAGTKYEIIPDDDWVIVDIGFSRDQKTCGLLQISRGSDERKQADPVTFGVLIESLRKRVQTTNRLNLVIEAPLSIAFSEKGNPVGRCFEKNGSNTRYSFHP